MTNTFIVSQSDLDVREQSIPIRIRQLQILIGYLAVLLLPTVTFATHDGKVANFLIAE